MVFNNSKDQHLIDSLQSYANLEVNLASQRNPSEYLRPFSLILPCKNDAYLLEKLLHIIENLDNEFFSKKFEVIIIDESTDQKSIEIIDKLPLIFSNLNMKITRVPPGTGLLTSELIGLKAAMYPWKVVMDCDLQHSPKDIIKLLEKLNSQVDLVVGSRFLDGSEFQLSIFRRVVSILANAYVKIILPFAIYLTDTTSGFFAISEKVSVENVQIKGSKTLLFIISKNPGLKIAEVPITFNRRIYGKSKLFNPLYLMRFPLEIYEYRKYYLKCKKGDSKKSLDNP